MSSDGRRTSRLGAGHDPTSGARLGPVGSRSDRTPCVRHLLGCCHGKVIAGVGAAPPSDLAVPFAFISFSEEHNGASFCSFHRTHKSDASIKVDLRIEPWVVTIDGAGSKLLGDYLMMTIVGFLHGYCKMVLHISRFYIRKRTQPRLREGGQVEATPLAVASPCSSSSRRRRSQVVFVSPPGQIHNFTQIHVNRQLVSYRSTIPPLQV